MQEAATLRLRERLTDAESILLLKLWLIQGFSVAEDHPDGRRMHLWQPPGSSVGQQQRLIVTRRWPGWRADQHRQYKQNVVTLHAHKSWIRVCVYGIWYMCIRSTLTYMHMYAATG